MALTVLQRACPSSNEIEIDIEKSRRHWSRGDIDMMGGNRWQAGETGWTLIVFIWFTGAEHHRTSSRHFSFSRFHAPVRRFSFPLFSRFFFFLLIRRKREKGAKGRAKREERKEEVCKGKGQGAKGKGKGKGKGKKEKERGRGDEREEKYAWVRGGEVWEQRGERRGEGDDDEEAEKEAKGKAPFSTLQDPTPNHHWNT